MAERAASATATVVSVVGVEAGSCMCTACISAYCVFVCCLGLYAHVVSGCKTVFGGGGEDPSSAVIDRLASFYTATPPLT